MKHFSTATIQIMILAIVLGAGSGVIATALTNSALSQYAFELSKLTEPLRLTQAQPRAVPQGYEDALTTLQTESLKAVGSVFSSAIPATGFSTEAALGPVVALTSDGWMLSAFGSVASQVALGDQSCVIDDVRVHGSGLSFLHCETSNAPVVDLGEGYDLAPGDQVFVVEGPERFVFTSVKSLTWGGSPVQASDEPSRRIALSFDSTLKAGSPVFNLSGELVGVIDPTHDEPLVIPFEHLAIAFEQVLEGREAFSSSTLGVKAIELSHTVGLPEDVTHGLKSGALLFDRGSVVAGGAAQTAGLLRGDVILSFDGETIGENRTLDDLVARVMPGVEVVLVVDRGGERMEFTVTLGSSSK